VSGEPPPPPPAAGTALVVTAEGGLVVATDELLAHTDRLRLLGDDLADDLRRTPTVSGVGVALDELTAVIGRAWRLADETLVGVRRAIEGYADLERDLVVRQHRLAAVVGAHLGGVARLMGLFGLGSPPFVLLVALVGWGMLPDRGEGRLAEVRRTLLEHPEWVTSPEFVRAIRLAVTSLDEAGLSALGLPPPLAIALGDEGTGFFGLETSAAGLMTAGALVGLFRETPVRVDRVAATPLDAPPSGVGDRLDRIPEGDQVRIERYEVPDGPPRFVVYVGPTETFSPSADTEPWDLTSSVAGVAGLSAGSYRATELAMLDAGVRPGDEVQFVGFSQGGLVATLLAASGDWNAVGLETHGAPTGNIELPDGLAGMAVRNTDDLVPALAGPQRDQSLLQVEREAFVGDRPVPTGVGAPAHQRSAYAETAALIDGAESAAVREQIARMNAFTADYATVPGSTLTVMTYHGERIAPEATSSRR
jgi:hypothetical protein